MKNRYKILIAVLIAAAAVPVLHFLGIRLHGVYLLLFKVLQNALKILNF